MKISVIAALVISTAASSQTIEFKGLKFTERIEEVREKLGFDPRCMEPLNGMISCYDEPAEFSYAGHPATSISVDLIDGVLAAVVVRMLTRSSDSHVVSTISSKYGKPTTRINPLISKSGIKHQAKIYEWTVRGGRISVANHEPPTDMLLVSIESSAKAKWFDRVNRVTPKAKKDI